MNDKSAQSLEVPYKEQAEMQPIEQRGPKLEQKKKRRKKKKKTVAPKPGDAFEITIDPNAFSCPPKCKETQKTKQKKIETEDTQSILKLDKERVNEEFDKKAKEEKRKTKVEEKKLEKAEEEHEVKSEELAAVVNSKDAQENSNSSVIIYFSLLPAFIW